MIFLSQPLGRKFAAIRAKLSSGQRPTKERNTPVAKPVKVIDLTTSAIPSDSKTICVARLLDSCPAWDAVCSKLESSHGSQQPIAICVLAPYHAMLAHAGLAALVGSKESEEAGFFYVVLPTEADLVWFCGGFRNASEREGAMRAIINEAIASKRRGAAFAKVAKTWLRLGELAGGNNGSRLEHLFSKTDPLLRAQLQMDAEASYSITDDVTADEITAKCASLPGVSGRGIETTVVDLTACVGGNLMSFSKRFAHVVSRLKNLTTFFTSPISHIFIFVCHFKNLSLALSDSLSLSCIIQIG